MPSIRGELLDAAELALRRARILGATYSEARVQVVGSNQLLMRNGILEAFGTQSSAGICVRVLVGGAMGFSSTNNPDKIGRATENAVGGAKATMKASKSIKLSDEDFAEASFSSKVTQAPADVPVEEKVEYMKEVEESVAQKGITARVISLSDSRELTHFINSDGARVTGDVTRVEARVMLTLVMGGRAM